MGFTGLDYLVLVTYLAATAIFGALLGRGQLSTGDYFLAGKQMPWWAISFSIVATETSTLTFIGAPTIAYTGDMTFLQVAIGYLIGKLLVSFILLPGYFGGEIQSAYEVLNQRFGSATKNFSALIFQVTRMLADGVRLFATALALSVAVQMADVWTIMIIALITVIYTVYGGMRAVVWNDVVQLIIYIGGALIAGYLILVSMPGGWNEVLQVARSADKLRLWDFTFSLTIPYTFWAGMIGGAFLTFATHGTDQMMVQRYLACGDKLRSQVALIVSGVLVILQFLLFLFIGVLLFAYYKEFPLDQELGHVNEIFPIFIVEEIPSGLSGLIIAAIFAAAMSSLSSSLNSLASSSINDFYRPWFEGRSEEHYLRVSRLFTLGWGAVLTLIALLSRNWGEVLNVGLSITSFTMGSVLGIFLLGLTRSANQRGGLLGMLAGLVAMLAVIKFTSIAWPWFVLIGSSATFATGILASGKQSRGPRIGNQEPRTGEPGKR